MSLKDRIAPEESFTGKYQTYWDAWGGSDALNLDVLRQSFPFADWDLMRRAHYRGGLGSWGGYIDVALCADTTWCVCLFKYDEGFEYIDGFSVLLARQQKFLRAVRSFIRQYQAVGTLLVDHGAEKIQQLPEEPEA